MRYLFSVLFLAFALSNFSSCKECPRPTLSKGGTFKLTQLDSSAFRTKGTVMVNGVVKEFDATLDIEGWNKFKSQSIYEELKQLNDPGFNDYLKVFDYKICLEEKGSLTDENKALVLNLLGKLLTSETNTSNADNVPANKSNEAETVERTESTNGTASEMLEKVTSEKYPKQ